MKYIVCFSGGMSSALVAIEAVRKYGNENVILLNHDISEVVEHKDIKRFKNEVAEYLGLKITYANMEGWESKTPLKIAMDIGAFKVGQGTALCTSKLKTEPFKKWLKENYPATIEDPNEDIVILYGFDKNETDRIQRRIGVMSIMGYKTDYPLALWERTINHTEEIGILEPVTYKLFRHANCLGCLKAGKQQWYVIYCIRQDIWEQAKQAEKEIGYSILKDVYMQDLEEEFRIMKYEKMICPDEKTPAATFWAKVNKVMPGQLNFLPCECAF